MVVEYGLVVGSLLGLLLVIVGVGLGKMKMLVVCVVWLVLDGVDLNCILLLIFFCCVVVEME